MSFTYGSVCSGIEAASVAWQPLGWKPLWFAETEAFPSAVLEHHWPHVPNLGDMRNIADQILSGAVPAPDVLVGGTPCQSFSSAGKGASLSDPRGRLTLAFAELANAIDTKRKEMGCEPVIVVWENVPKVRFQKDNAFGQFLGILAKEPSPLQPSGGRWTDAGCVYSRERTIAWRILDAQYFGLAQRRKRLFLVASSGKRINPAEILFEQSSLSGDSESGTGTGKDFTASAAQYAFTDSTEIKIAPTLQTSCHDSCRWFYQRPIGQHSRADGFVCVVQGTQDPIVSDKAHCLGRNQGQENALCLPFDTTQITSPDNHSNPRYGDPCHTLSQHQHAPCIGMDGIVRKLTPLECERLMGLPDHHTRIPWRNRSADQCPDTNRYAAIGNSMAVNVMAWISVSIAQHSAENTFEKAVS